MIVLGFALFVVGLMLILTGAAGIDATIREKEGGYALPGVLILGGAAVTWWGITIVYTVWR